MLTREEFLLRRKSGIGGSDVAAIAGLSPWRSPLDVYYDKLKIELGADSREELLPVGETAASYWGSVHEAAIGKAYTAVTGSTVDFIHLTAVMKLFNDSVFSSTATNYKYFHNVITFRLMMEKSDSCKCH